MTTVRHLVAALVAVATLAAPPAVASTLLYEQNFENPNGFVNDGGDVNIFRTVQDNYGGQPVGFVFTQANTVETLLVGGSQAWGTGFLDPGGIAGSYVVGMLSDVQNDLLGLAFNVGTFDFLNLRMDISSIDLDRWGGPFTPVGGIVPTFGFTLYDNPSGAAGLGGGTVLDSCTANGVASARNTLDWREALCGLDATASTNGNVILRIDLLSGGYAAFDNIRIVASDTEGDVGTVPEPATMAVLGAGLLGLAGWRRRR